jgi:hypothetical protein
MSPNILISSILLLFLHTSRKPLQYHADLFTINEATRDMSSLRQELRFSGWLWFRRTRPLLSFGAGFAMEHHGKSHPNAGGLRPADVGPYFCPAAHGSTIFK